ncbi:MAG: helix-turn-helix domain-containing protein [Stigonema ocellatum SAG 48.90 = DSM 106950]|nr:helix-turn-helix domain-containing protein [Stigonema ocellatum SAG 48.90 = DSM 106950]
MGDVVVPSDAERNLAKATSKVLSSHRDSSIPLRLRILDDPTEATIELPASFVRILIRAVEEMAQGNGVTLTPVNPELTTQEAAEMLNISRPTLINLLDEGKIVYRRVGNRRRVRFDSLMQYRRYVEVERKKALEALTAYDQEIGI